MAHSPRKDRNFFKKIQVSDTAFINAQLVKWTFASIGIALLVESDNPNDAVQYSFDGGENIHGDLTPGLPSEGIIFDNRIENNVVFRRISSGSAVTVRVEAWRHSA